MERLVCPKLRRHDLPLLRGLLNLPTEHDDVVAETDEPSAVLGRLRERELWPQAMRLLAYGLPDREAVWWSCMCVRHTAGEISGAERSVVAAAESWVHRPDDVERRDVELATRAAAFAVPGAWCGLGVAWSRREPFRPDICTGRAAVKAVGEAVIRGRADAARQRRRHLAFYGSGVDIANGGAGRLPSETTDHEEARPCPSL